VAVSKLEPLYRAYERLTELSASLGDMRATRPQGAQQLWEIQQWLRMARENVRTMIETARADLDELQAIYQGVVGLRFRY